jgi:putative OPT family oligopeptide transporter
MVFNRACNFWFRGRFSATMIGAGYLVGYEMAISIMLGAVIAWIGVLPIYTAFFSHLLPFTNQELPAIASGLWSNHIRYVGIGAMLFAGVFTFLRLLRPLCNSVYLSLTHIIAKKTLEIKPQDRDIPTSITAIVISAMAVALYFFLAKILPITIISSIMPWKLSLLLSLLAFVIIIGFLFSVITSYFSGMVGVTASPGSAIVIAGILFIAWVILHFVNYAVGVNWSPEIIRAAEAITIIIGSILTGIAAIANDNSQDLKVGQIIGAVPWQQQTMLLLGVLVSSLVIPPVMQVLFDVYGIADVTPRVGMDPAQTLPAPTSALMAALTQGVFQHTLPWSLLATGAIITLLFAWSRFSLLGIAIGMYLPLATSMPLLIGGAIAYIVRLKHLKKAEPLREMKIKRHRGVLVACGLVAGSALMDVMLAIPFSAMHSADALAIMPEHLYAVSVILGGVSVMALSLWIMNITLKD